MAIITIQGLSTCKSFVELSGSFIDDITGKLMPMDTKALAQRVIDDPKIITNYRQRMRALRLAEEYMVAKRYTEQRDRAHKLIADRLNPPKPEFKPASNQIVTESGLVFTIKRPANAFKRRL